jgi:hypothetical protein
MKKELLKNCEKIEQLLSKIADTQVTTPSTQKGVNQRKTKFNITQHNSNMKKMLLEIGGKIDNEHCWNEHTSCNTKHNMLSKGKKKLLPLRRKKKKNKVNRKLTK